MLRIDVEGLLCGFAAIYGKIAADMSDLVKTSVQLDHPIDVKRVQQAWKACDQQIEDSAEELAAHFVGGGNGKNAGSNLHVVA